MKKILIIALLLIISKIYAQNQSEYTFTQLNTSNGLSQNTVRALCLDEKGFVWAGTYDGLNRYDGYNFVWYKPELGNKVTLSDPRIRSIVEDKNGFLWIIKYDNTTSCYNPHLDCFVDVINENGEKLSLDYSAIFISKNKSVVLFDANHGAVAIDQNGEGQPIVKWIDTSSRFVTASEDARGNVWLAGSCLTKIDNQWRSQQYDIFDTKMARDMCIADSMIYITSDQNKLWRFNANTGQLQPSLMSPQKALLLSCEVADSTMILISTRNNGMIAYQTDKNAFIDAPVDGNNVINSVAKFIVDNKNQVWVSDHSGIIYRYNKQIRKLTPIRAITPDIAKVIDEERYVVYVDTKGNEWITTYGCGLLRYNPKKKEATSYRYNGTQNGLSSDYLLSITEDKYGNIWVGCEYAGIVKIAPKRYNMKKLKPEVQVSLGSSNNVRATYEDKWGNIWLGTKNGGLYVYDSTLTTQLYARKGLNPYAITCDTEGKMWIGTKGNGIYVYNTKEIKEIAHYTNNANISNSLCHNSVFNIICDHRGRVWIASFGGGIDLVDESTGEASFQHFFKNNGNLSNVRALCEDHNGKIWAACFDGLISFSPDEFIADPNSYELYQYDATNIDGINCKDVKTVCEDNQQRIWIGTAGGGLNLVCSDANGKTKFEKFTTRHGLPSDIITSIINANDSILWIGTENGLVSFNTNNNTFSDIELSDNTFMNYINDNSCMRMRNGQLLCGTLDGLLIFDPLDVLIEGQHQLPRLTGLIIDGEMVAPQTPRSPLKKAITDTQEINLEYDQNTFTLTFATLNMSNITANKYTYKLEGFDATWSAPTNINSATYKRISAGKYRFLVRNASNKNNEYSSLIINIEAPWWQTKIAIISYIVLFIIIFLTIIYIIVRINKLRTSVAVEHEITDYKLRFFTNISHEFRTPLTLIRGTVDALMEETNDMTDIVKGHVNILVRNTRHLSRLIDQLLEFRKIQNNILTLNIENTDISAFLSDIFSTFTDSAEQKKIQFNLDVPDTWMIQIDRSKIEKIVYNLLSNAFKFTPDGGNIFLKAEETLDNKCRISVIDNGCGVPKAKQAQIFKRFVQANFSANGTGVGLSMVKEFVDVHHGTVEYQENVGGGSKFIVEIPTNYSEYSDVNIIENDSMYDTSNELSIEQPIEDEAVSEEMQYTVLVIDDNKDIRDFLIERLSQHHYLVITAENGAEGLEIANKQAVDIIVCDVKMPIMDGLEFTQKIRADLNTNHLPIILLTAHPSDALQLESSESGADAYIMKPFNFKYLLSRINKLIEQREILRERFAQGMLEEEIPTPDFIKDLNEIIEQNASRVDFSLEDLMAAFRISRSNIYKKIRQEANCTPGEYVKAWRMNKARELLLEGRLSISQIANEIGMQDPFYFSKCFKRQYGCSPSKYFKERQNATGGYTPPNKN